PRQLHQCGHSGKCIQLRIAAGHSGHALRQRDSEVPILMRQPTLKLMFFGLAVAAAQQQPTVKFTSNTNLVVLDVTVRDKSGKLVEGLKKEDFTIMEDGKPQAVQVFEFQKLKMDQLPTLAPPPPPSKEEPVSRKVETINMPVTGQVQYHDKRLLCLFFDLSA